VTRDRDRRLGLFLQKREKREVYSSLCTNCWNRRLNRTPFQIMAIGMWEPGLYIRKHVRRPVTFSLTIDEYIAVNHSFTPYSRYERSLVVLCGFRHNLLPDAFG